LLILNNMTDPIFTLAYDWEKKRSVIVRPDCPGDPPKPISLKAAADLSTLATRFEADWFTERHNDVKLEKR